MPGDPPPIEEREIGGEGACSTEGTARFLGQRVTAELGARIMRETGASQLRWGPPGAVFTMDYRPDRVNVMYDQAMAVTEIRCG